MRAWPGDYTPGTLGHNVFRTIRWEALDRQGLLIDDTGGPAYYGPEGCKVRCDLRTRWWYPYRPILFWYTDRGTPWALSFAPTAVAQCSLRDSKGLAIHSRTGANPDTVVIPMQPNRVYVLTWE